MREQRAQLGFDEGGQFRSLGQPDQQMVGTEITEMVSRAAARAPAAELGCLGGLLERLPQCLGGGFPADPYHHRQAGIDGRHCPVQ